MNYQQIIELLLGAIPALAIIFFVALITMLIIRWFKNPRQPAIQQQPINQFNNLYDRIHNYQHAQTTPSSRHHSQQQNSTLTDSHYHHAIKLLQRGIDIKSLIEYCNLTHSEAELLQAVYGKNGSGRGHGRGQI